ncbi:MAG: NADH:ubiquinone reductase (Na(+)-transporting) subunit C [Chlorobi bacterium]|nr:NADH:ubiquinone reductase (Na(+)-transporting) subunit C [Chlorobiota bacterium]
MDRQGNTYTFIYASVLVVVVAAVLAFVSQTLKPIQQKNIEVARKIDILKSVNIQSTSKDAVQKYEKYIGNNSFILNYNGEKIEGDAFAVDLEKELKKKPEDRKYPIFICTVDGQKKYIIPVRGKGLWGPIWGYISLNEDKKTIFGATFGHKGETPGLGAEIEKPQFQKPFSGKTIFDENGNFTSIKVVKGKDTSKDPHAVDAISGGTITSKGVEAMLRDCLSGYQKFLKGN